MNPFLALALTHLALSLMVLAYCAPTFVGLTRHVRGQKQVVVVNLLLGWTALGWVVALVMALRDDPMPASWPA